MGGSGGNIFSPKEVRNWIEDSQDETARAEQHSEVSAVLGDLLAQYNERDVDLIRDRLDEIEEVLEDHLETSIDLRFGGSVAKHTFVDGLSDVDALAVLRDPELSSMKAREVLDRFAEILGRSASYDVEVKEGQLAVTIEYADGMEIQILPAVRTATGMRIPDANSDAWSRVIRPQSFARRLTERNRECNGRLVPVIKLAKAALADLPDSHRPSGYHVESMAVEIFERYSGPSNHKAMLQYFFENGRSSVLRPIEDNTGQSEYVDDYLGYANSRDRLALSSAMDRIARRMSSADSVGSPEAWLDAIGE